MARPSQEAIDTFVSVTGASESVALQKLEEHGGDLNEAVNAYFDEGDRTISRTFPRNEIMDMFDLFREQSREVASSFFSEARRHFDAFPLLDPNFGRSSFDRMSEIWRWGPFGSFPSEFRDWNEPRVSHPREVREIPIESNDENGSRPTIEDVTDSTAAQAHGPEIHGTVTFYGEDDDDIPSAAHGASRNYV